MTCEDNGLIEKLSEKLLECEEDLKNRKDDVDTWTDSLEELSRIKDAFLTDENNRLDGKTILDIGTDCVKPLYIALKFEPDKIIGIDENLPSIASDIKLKSRLLTKTKIGFYACSFFDEETFENICREEKINKFDFVLVSKTLHHLRTAECVEEHKCREDEKCCKYGFEEQVIFEKLLRLGKRVIIYEFFDPNDTDDDKVRGRGGYFTTKEWEKTFKSLSERYRVEFITPLKLHLDKKESEKIVITLRKVDCICFYVEEQDVKDTNVCPSNL